MTDSVDGVQRQRRIAGMVWDAEKRWNEEMHGGHGGWSSKSINIPAL
ncbi:hypothetical protein [Siccibacter turicensis]|nr:hypothetical protein [Siccibacter turicensis]